MAASPRSTSSARIAQPARSSYFAVSRAPRYSVLFALPLLIAYEGLAAILSQPGKGELRNGADAIFRGAFIAVAGPRGPAVFMGLIVLIGLGLVVRDTRANRGGVRFAIFGGMLAESCALAAVFGVIIGLTTAKLLGSLHVAEAGNLAASVGAFALPNALEVLQRGHPAGGALAAMSGPERLMLSLGAGLYEELFFRVVLVTTLATGARALIGFSRGVAGTLAAIVGALVFSAFHYIGPYGDPFQLRSFTFRALSGLAFSALYLTRGFGITAWTHALYDAFLLVA